MIPHNEIRPNRQKNWRLAAFLVGMASRSGAVFLANSGERFPCWFQLTVTFASIKVGWPTVGDATPIVLNSSSQFIG